MNLLVWLMITLSSLNADTPVVIWGEGCPTVSGKANFEVARYVGQWYQIIALPFLFASSSDTCTWAKYTLLENGNIGVNNTQINSDGKRTGVTGEAAPIEGESGELDVEFFTKPSTTASPNYFVLDTDYTEFAYVWGCSSLYFAHSPMLWILNRAYNHTEEYVKQQAKNALDILTSFGYDSDSVSHIWNDLVITDQTNCDYDSRHNTAFTYN